METKKLEEFDMRDDFSIPVFVGYELVEISGIKGVDPNSHHAGILTRKGGSTFLELADFPEKKDYISPNPSGVIVDHDDKVANQDDVGNWYASSWDGGLQFVFRDFFRINASENFARNHFVGDTSKWRISDYSIVDKHLADSKIKKATLSMDHVYSWFNFFRPEQDWANTKSIVFKDLCFENQPFALVIGANGKERHDLHIYQKTAYMTISIEFDNPQAREFTYHLAVTLRNFLHIVMGKEVRINQIILNRDVVTNNSEDESSSENVRENWFLEQSYLPESVNETNAHFNVPYHEIADKFNPILSQYLMNTKLQQFVGSYLTVDQFHTPVDTQIVTLVSAVESYYSEARYSFPPKKIKNAKEKLARMAELVYDPNKLFNDDIRGSAGKVEELIEEMVDARDYIVHGERSKKYTSEAELVPDLIIFKKLIRKAITQVGLLRVQRNN
ncbi:hypothetical protein Lpp78_02866 [Lacticaseibacillus paracasei subsp. paracasei CNCM I-2877]|nr:hypothetical protein Lpp78_02866 [Lacticaseibacillus paracasei subsp. paracasei CNCM I-2877]